MSNRKPWRLPLFLSGLVLLSQAFSLPSPVRDAATLEWATGFSMHYPLWHLVFTPFCSVSDYLTALSLNQLKVMVAYIVAMIFILGGSKRGTLLFLCFLAFVAWGALIPHPMGRLVAEDPNTLLIDFHSHTSYSHDGRRKFIPFTPQANERWHAEQGYEASFITDHNLVDASEIAHADPEAHWNATGYRSLEGEEVSLQKTHLVILGNREKVDNRRYDGDFARIPVFVTDMHKKGYPVIASLPEYWLYHWLPSPPPSPLSEGRGSKGEGYGSVQDFVNWGMDGFEIVNSAPKALDFPLSDRLQIVALCRTKNLFMTGISDNHGFGYATAAWNAMSLPGWRTLDPDSLQKAVLFRLKNQGFNANRVLERAHFMPWNSWQLVLSPMAHLWYYWRLLQPLQAVSWVLWIWIVAYGRKT